MGNVKIASIPERDSANMPFDLDVQALSDWLYRLPRTEMDKSCEQICGVLQTLNQAGIDKKTHRLYLEEISKYVQLFENQIESVYLDLPIPLPDYQQHCVEWLVWCFLSLAKNFQQLAEGLEHDKIKATMLYQALFALAQAYLHISAIYKEPCEGFWLICYQIYSSAETDGIQNIEIKQDKQQGLSINFLFKRLLVFSLCDYQQFRPREMKQVFVYLGQFANQLEICRQVDGKYSKGLFAIPLSMDRGPLNLISEKKINRESAIRYFAPANLAKNIYFSLQEDRRKKGAIKDINNAVIMRVVKTLGLAQTRKFKRMAKRGQVGVIVGFANIRDFLWKNIDDKVQGGLQSLPLPGKPYDYDISQFELIDDDEGVIQASKLSRKRESNKIIDNIFTVNSSSLSSNLNLWDSEKPLAEITDVDIKDFALLNSSANGYGIGFSDFRTKVKVGDLFALVSSQESHLELALVRRLCQPSEKQFNLGVELIGVAKEVVLMKSEDRQDKQIRAVFLPAIKALKQPDMVVYSSSDFNIGEVVTIHKDKKDVSCRLSKQVNLTASISQVELFYL